MPKVQKILLRLDSLTRGWCKTAAALCETSESAFIRDAIREKVQRHIATLPSETDPAPAGDPLIMKDMRFDRSIPHPRRASRQVVTQDWEKVRAGGEDA